MVEVVCGNRRLKALQEACSRGMCTTRIDCIVHDRDDGVEYDSNWAASPTSTKEDILTARSEPSIADGGALMRSRSALYVPPRRGSTAFADEALVAANSRRAS